MLTSQQCYKLNLVYEVMFLLRQLPVIPHSWSGIWLLIIISKRLRMNNFTRLNLSLRMTAVTCCYRHGKIAFCSIHATGASDSVCLHHSWALLYYGKRIRQLGNKIRAFSTGINCKLHAHWLAKIYRPIKFLLRNMCRNFALTHI